MYVLKDMFDLNELIITQVFRQMREIEVSLGQFDPSIRPKAKKADKSLTICSGCREEFVQQGRYLS
ncbi:hypothetical protein BSQ33_10035 [Vibrio gazogenes]|uniref:Uncharacterized protein n=1 Tax=Vibrio gazogenes TaxID=687 RepID=A0A1Z2SFS8_VIBGA|nr:hypothetical protein BSQ33_10035 [Vibrio gazogenes]